MGRFVLTALHDFDIDGLRSVLVQPKNSIIKQFEIL